jgi:KipI family sensor histidine kinase inhibitor
MTESATGASTFANPTIHTIGVDGLLVRFGTDLTEAANRAALALRAALDHADLPGVLETTTALTSVYVRFDLALTDHTTLWAAVGRLAGSRDWGTAPLPQGRRLWQVPAVFGTDLAPQLADAAALAGLSPADAITQLCAAPLRVQTIGFAPGQPYLGQLPTHWNIPRQTDLTPRVPEGALVVAIRQMVLFSVSTPTGWRHVGQTALRLFRPDRPDPFLLRPGDEVQFYPVEPEELVNLHKSHNGGATSRAIT